MLDSLLLKTDERCYHEQAFGKLRYFLTAENVNSRRLPGHFDEEFERRSQTVKFCPGTFHARQPDNHVRSMRLQSGHFPVKSF